MSAELMHTDNSPPVGAKHLEKIEYHEHLRILERGHRIKAVKVDSLGISVDTELDLDEVKYKMEKDPYFKAILKTA